MAFQNKEPKKLKQIFLFDKIDLQKIGKKAQADGTSRSAILRKLVRDNL